MLVDMHCHSKGISRCCKVPIEDILERTKQAGIDAIVLTKYDSTAKGGVAISIGKELGLPVAFICNGEKYDNIRKFDSEEYINNL